MVHALAACRSLVLVAHHAETVFCEYQVQVWNGGLVGRKARHAVAQIQQRQVLIALVVEICSQQRLYICLALVDMTGDALK